MTNLKTVLIGCGIIATTHTAVLNQLGQEIVAVCDTDEEKARRHCEKYGLKAKIYKDYRQMLDAEQPDVAHILTPHYLHAEMVIEVLGRNIHCLCEKPLYIREEEFGRIEAAVKASKATLGVCFQHRYVKTNQYVKEQVEKEGFQGASAFQAWHKDNAYYAMGDWRGKYATEGGALLINQAIHCIDQLVWICGMPERVTAKLSAYMLGDIIEAEDTAELFFDYGDGISTQLYATNIAAANFTGETYIKTGEAAYEYNAKRLFRDNAPVDIDEEAKAFQTKSYWGSGHYNLIRHYYACLQNGEHFPVDIYEASKAVEIVLAATRSNGKPIILNKQR